MVPVYCSLSLSFMGASGFSFVSRDEVARPGKLAERVCVALPFFRVMLFCSRSCVLRALKDFAASSLECQA